MIWLTWRQFRAQSIVTAVALAAFTVLMVVTGVQVASLVNSSGINSCHVNCDSVLTTLRDELDGSAVDKPLFFFGLAVLYLAPALIGLFWGAPLVTRELETGTFRLAWNQSVTRTRWLTVKLGLIGLAAMATAGLFSLIVTWWSSPIDRFITSSRSDGVVGFQRLDPFVFGARGIAPIGYAAFAFALGVTAGVLIRRTLPAMAATIVAFAGIQLAWPNWVRPHLITPVRAILPLNVGTINELMIGGRTMTVVGAVSKPGAWILSNQTIGTSGHPFTGPPPNACGNNAPFQACQAAIGRLHLRQLVVYQPASRFWAFQWYETAIFLTVAVALAGFCFWWIRRRRLA